MTGHTQAEASHGQVNAGPSGAGEGGADRDVGARVPGSAGQGAKRYQKRLLVAEVIAVVAFCIDLALPDVHASAATVLEVLVTVATVAGFGWLCVAWRSFIASGRTARADYAGLSHDSVLVSSRAASLDAFRREMAARYGDQVAALSERITQALFRMHLFSVVFLLYTFAYLNLYAHISYVGGLFFFVIAVPLLGAALWYGLAARRDSRLLTESLNALARSGVRPPGQLPTSPAEYIARCEASGVPAYPHGRPVWNAAGR